MKIREKTFEKPFKSKNETKESSKTMLGENK